MKEKFIKSTIILVIGGFITKILSMLIRIIITRIIGLEGIGLYMLVMPTFNLFITISTFSLPVSLSKLVAEGTRNNKNIILGIIPIALIFNLIVMLVIIFSADFIACNLLNNENLYYPVLATAFTLPFITLSSITRGYFFGKEKMFPHVISNIFEQIIRIIIITYLTPILLNKGIIAAITGIILFNIASELFSIIILFLFIPKKIKITKQDLKLDHVNFKDTLSISIPTTFGRLISATGQFLEPIIITYIFIKLGYSNIYITNQYGIMSGYVLPMVMMPSFLTGAISSALLPVISKYSKNNKFKLIKRKIKQAIFYSLLIGIPCSLLLVLFPDFFLNLIFKTGTGSNYLKLAAIIFLFSYIQGPLVSSLQAVDKADKVMVYNGLGILIKTIALFVFSMFDMGMLSILFSYLIYYIFTTLFLIKEVNKV